MTLLVLTETLTWSKVLLIALIGIMVVFVVLLLMVGIMYVFGAITKRQHKVKNTVAPAAISDEEVAAIMTALKLYKRAIHDKDSEMLTINRVTRMYSPWNSKIHGLTPLPERKK